MSDSGTTEPKGRGSVWHPPNRFERIALSDDWDQLTDADDGGVRSVRTEYFVDDSRSLVVENDSPDIGFRYSVNPYRGCMHGCAYCYARPTHEYLGLDAGLDFESKVFVKQRAPELLRTWLSRASWECEPIVFSGVTDCYQPAERAFTLTRKCLEVAWDCRQPVSIVTKNALVLRDRDLLIPMAEHRLAAVAVSITTLDGKLASEMEPRTSTPAARLRTVRELSESGVPVQAMLGPVIPGLNDVEIPSILEAARDAGASAASYILLRLPDTVLPVFNEWLERTRPHDRKRIESRIRACRGGGMNDPRFGSRMRGEGPMARQIADTFRVFAAKAGLQRRLPPLDATRFRPPGRDGRGQLRLFR